MSHTPQLLIKDGGIPEIKVGDEDVLDRLDNIEHLLRKMVMHLAILSDEKISDDDVEED